MGCFRDPPQCDSLQDCNNFLVWNDTGYNTIDFFISAKINSQNTQGKDNFWTSISFNTDTKMVSKIVSKSSFCFHKEYLEKNLE